LAQGGESVVFIADVPEADLVLKMPLNPAAGGEAMTEAQLLLTFASLGGSRFLVEVLEEIIIVDEDSKEILAYCSIVGRAARTLEHIDPWIRERTPAVAQGFKYLAFFFLHQGIKILKALDKFNIYYGDFKEANLLVSFGTMEMKLGDFGISFIIEPECNYLKGLTYSYAC
jgi:hypothetical protein